MTLSEYAKQEGITEAGAIFRIRRGKVAGQKVPGKTGPRWEITDLKAASNGNGHKAAAFTIEDIAKQAPDLSVSKALQVLQILNG